MTRKLIVDSLLYWIKEYGVDGFRFDIMGLIDTGTIQAAYAAAKRINPLVIFEGEGWQGMYDGPGTDFSGASIAGTDQAHAWTLSAHQTAVGMFNDGIRSLLKGGGMGEGPGFLTGLPVPLYNLFQQVRGNPYTVFSAPTADYVMNYMTVHDNLDLYDAVANGLHLTSSAADNLTALQRMRIGYTAVLTSQGTSFLYGGDEMFRSREIAGTASANVVRDPVTGRSFVSNAYNASDALNHIPWGQVYAGDPIAGGFTNLATTQPGAQLYRYVQGLVALRKATDAFRKANGTLAGQVTMIPPDN
jgi:pullulanase/glycogen debranching enzyme